MLTKLALAGVFGVALAGAAAGWAYGFIHASFAYQTIGSVIYLIVSVCALGAAALRIKDNPAS